MHQDTTGNDITGIVAEELAFSVLNHKSLEEFGTIPCADLRANRTYDELDLSGNGLKAAEGRVLVGLLKLAPKVSGINLDGNLVPIRKFRGGKPCASEAEALKGKLFEGKALDMIKNSIDDPLAEEEEKEKEGEEGEDSAGDAALKGTAAAAKEQADMEAEAEAAESDIDMSKLQLGVASACVISGFCSGNTTLVSLNVSFNKIGAEGATILAQGVKKCGGLTSLNVAWNRILPEGACALASCLVNNTTLTALNLGCNELCAINSFGQGQYNTDGIEAIADALKSSGIQFLDVSSNCLTGVTGRKLGFWNTSGIEKLCDGLPGSKVARLVVDGNVLHSDGTSLLSAALERHTSLTSLSLADCNITESGREMGGLSQLVDTLKKLNQLQDLNLDGCELRGAGVKLVAKWLQAAGEPFESIFIERGSNGLDEGMEALLREAVGDKFYLHLERARAGYEKNLDAAAAKLEESRQRRMSMDSMVNNAKEKFGKGLDVAVTPDTPSELSPSPPEGSSKNKSPKAKGAGARRGSTGRVTVG